MTHFEAIQIEMDLSVNLEYSGITKKTRDEVFQEWFDKHGFSKIKEAINVLCDDLDVKRSRYMNFLKIARIMEAK